LFSIAALDEEENGPVVRVLKLVHPENRMLQVISVRSDAESIGRILYVRDITHESEVNRMKSEFLAHAAHELRTPMTSILGFTELLLMRDFDPKMQKDILQTVHRQTQWLVDIINELLDLARIEARRGKDFKREEIDLHELINEVLQMQSFDQQRWPLELAFADEPIHVSVDAAKIKQALTNILGNALKYSPEGGVINIRVSTALEQAVIEIEDSGIGMNAEELRHFGERFWRADRSGKVPGTGLGMSIVKEIIELHGGCVTAQSSTGAGTIVTVQIPLIRQMAG
jgi:signal transduction histidine kinase